MSSPEASEAFTRARQAVVDLVPYPTQERVTQLFQETKPKVAELLDQSGIFSQLPAVVDQEAVINRITTLYALVHDYKIFDRLIIAATSRAIFPELVENRPHPLERQDDRNFMEEMNLAIRMKHGGITAEDIPSIESRRLFEARFTDTEDIGYSNLEIFEYGQRVPVYPTPGWKWLLDSYPTTRKYAESPHPDISEEARIYIGELIPQRPQ